MFETKNSSQLGDVFPTVVVGCEYGKDVEAIDIDLQSVTSYLREKGMSDKQILGLTIDFTDKVREPVPNRKDLSTVSHGEYFEDPDRVVVYRPEIQKQSTINIRKPDGKKYRVTFGIDETLEADVNDTIVHELEHFILKEDDALKQQNIDYRSEKIKEYVGRVTYTKKQMVLLASGALAPGLVIASVAELNDAANGEAELLGMMFGLALIGVDGMRRIITLLKIMRDESYNLYLNKPEEILARKAASEYSASNLIKIEPIKTHYAENDPAYNMLLVLAQRKGAVSAEDIAFQLETKVGIDESDHGLDKTL